MTFSIKREIISHEIIVETLKKSKDYRSLLPNYQKIKKVIEEAEKSIERKENRIKKDKDKTKIAKWKKGVSKLSRKIRSLTTALNMVSVLVLHSRQSKAASPTQLEQKFLEVSP
jgi:Mg2+ and Co2+ transporter CorA